MTGDVMEGRFEETDNARQRGCTVIVSYFDDA